MLETINWKCLSDLNQWLRLIAAEWVVGELYPKLTEFHFHVETVCDFFPFTNLNWMIVVSVGKEIIEKWLRWMIVSENEMMESRIYTEVSIKNWSLSIHLRNNSALFPSYRKWISFNINLCVSVKITQLSRGIKT